MVGNMPGRERKWIRELRLSSSHMLYQFSYRQYFKAGQKVTPGVIGYLFHRRGAKYAKVGTWVGFGSLEHRTGDRNTIQSAMEEISIYILLPCPILSPGSIRSGLQPVDGSVRW